MKTGIIFDMDGTLWDSSREVALSWNQVVVKCGMKPLTDNDLARVMGLPMDKLARALFPDMEAEASYDLMDACVVVENDYLESHGARLYPGVEETLRSLVRIHRQQLPVRLYRGVSDLLRLYADFFGFSVLREQPEAKG